MRGIRLAKNTFSSFIFQITTIICGFVLPHLILKIYGSAVNGLINSINQFLLIIALLEMGVGTVIQSSLYRPLAYNDEVTISKIIVSAEKFFKKIAWILLFYIICLVFFYPKIVEQQFSWLYSGSLILIIGISSFSQYYFGLVDRLLLTADQRGYIQYTLQTFFLVINTVLCSFLLFLGVSIHIVKLTTLLVFLVRPFLLRIYVNKNYNINRKITYNVEPIEQKWNGVAQHVAAVVLDVTDTIVLTLFSSLSNVSIYSVYYLVISGIKKLLMAMTNGIHSLIGELWAKKEIDVLNVTFGWVEWTIHTVTIIVFGCTGILIVPFVKVYTSGVTDANYVQPIFALILTIAHACHCLRLPYNIMILAGGHYKQTQNNYIISAGLNVFCSVIAVCLWGLVGVAIGTLVAMVYQTIWMGYYVSKNLLEWPFVKYIKQSVLDIIIVIIAASISQSFTFSDVTYLAWISLAVKTFLVWVAISFIINFLFNKDKVLFLIKKVRLNKI